jgi:hypothetical protein
MAGFTNRGKFLILQGVFRNTGLPTNFFVALCTSAIAPTPDTNVLSDLTEVPAGNGYTAGGISLTKNSTDFDVLTEDDAGTNDRAFLQLKDIVWTASGGTLPASGTGARYAVLLDDNSTVGSRQVLAYWDLVSNQIVSSGQTLTLQNCELRFTE